MTYSPLQQSIMLQAALHSIEAGIQTGDPGYLDHSDVTGILREPGASFVSLEINDALRGCMGSLEANRPLLEDITANAFAAAFRDPRFRKLEHQELNHVAITISVLGPARPIDFDSRNSLLKQIRPGIDGLILQERNYRATFLPVVWESIAEPQHFFAQLMQKAGLSDDYWSDTLRVWRYRTESFAAEVPRIYASMKNSITTEQD